MKQCLMTVCFLLLYTGVACAADVPNLLNLQSLVYGQDGNPIADPFVSVNVQIVDQNNKVLFQEMHPNVAVVKGAINLNVGDVVGGIPLAAFDPSTGPKFVDVTVNNISTFDLLPFNTVPYAMWCERALTVADGSIDSAQIKDGAIKLNHLADELKFGNLHGVASDSQIPSSVARQTDLNAHVKSTTAHPASAIFLDASGAFATQLGNSVQVALETLYNQSATEIADRRSAAAQLQQEVTTETANRQAGESNLQNQITTNVSSLQAQITSTNGALTSFENQTASNVTNLQNQITTNGNSITTLQGQVGNVLPGTTLQDQITSNNTTLQSQITTNVNNLQGQIGTVPSGTTLQGQITSNNTTLQSQITTNVANLQGQITSSNTSITTIQGQIGSVTPGTTLQDQITTNNSSIASLQSQINTSNGTETSLQSQIGGVSSSVAQQQGEIGNVPGGTTLQGEVDAHSSTLNNHETRITKLEGNVPVTSASQLLFASGNVDHVQGTLYGYNAGAATYVLSGAYYQVNFQTPASTDNIVVSATLTFNPAVLQQPPISPTVEPNRILVLSNIDRNGFQARCIIQVQDQVEEAAPCYIGFHWVAYAAS